MGVSSASIEDELIQLEVEAGLQLPKGTDNGEAISLKLYVDQVLDDQGNDVLRDEQCLPNGVRAFGRNHEAAVGMNVQNARMLVSKIVRLKPEVELARVARVKGRLEYAVPVDVRPHRVAAREGERVEDGDLSFYVGKVDASWVGYRIAGDPDKIVEIRGLNADGKVLRRGSSMSMDALVGEGKSGRMEFRGEPRGLIVYVVHEINRHSYPFEIQGLFAVPATEPAPARPQHQPGVWDASRWQALARTDVTGIDVSVDSWAGGKPEKVTPKVVIRRSPVVLTLDNNPESAWQANPTLKVYLPLIPELVGNLSAYRFELEQPPRDKDGTKSSFEEYWLPRSYMTRYEGDHVSFRGDVEVGAQGYMHYESQLDLGFEKGQAIGPVKGLLTVRVPTSLERQSVPLPAFGRRIRVGEHALRIVRIENDFIPSMLVEISGAPEKLVTVNGLGTDGLGTPAENPRYEGGSWRVRLNTGTAFDKLEVVSAGEQALIRVPLMTPPD